ncbi:MAG: peptidoglycan DD-metalloendopeptidase family protein [Nitrospiraceae bacterium]
MRRLGVIALAAAAWLAADAAAWAAKESDALSEKIARERKNLEKLKSRIEEEKQHAVAAEKKRDSMLQNLQQLDQRLVTLRHEHQDVVKDLSKKDRELSDLNGRLAELRGQMTDHQAAILARARMQYVQGRWGPMKVLFGAQNYTDFQRRFQYLSAVTQREYQVVEQYQRDVQKMEEAEHRRSMAREQVMAIRLNTERKLKEIQDLRKQKRQYLTKVSLQKDSYDRMVEELQRSAGRVDSILGELEQRRKLATSKPAPAGAISRAFKGSLPWPVEGAVVSLFGRQKHPTFQTYVQRKGIEIRSAEGSLIKAVMAGAVVYADWLKGYGLVVIVDHQNGFFSLYAHASKLLSKVGERVDAGQTIGETGDTGATGDNTLYFELRAGAEPVDPLQWLAKR